MLGDKMKLYIALLASVLMSTPALADEALAQKSGCLNCHAVDHKILGPSYKDVATKYKGVAGIEDKLVAKVKAGGSGVWGPIPMPANSPRVKEEDIRILVKWVLSQ